jgi:Mrp family chromosome partitioning ATPase
LKMADDLLKQMNVNVLGTVLNKVNLKERFSHYYYYRQYYSYYKKPFETMDEEQTAGIPIESISPPNRRKKA